MQDNVQFELVAQTDLVEEIVDALGALVAEARIEFLPNRIRTWMVEPASVAATYIDLDTSEEDRIEHYEVDDSGVTVGLNLETLDHYLGHASDTVRIAYGEKYNFKIHVSSEGVDGNVGGIDPANIRESPDKPDLNWPAVFDVPGGEIDEAVGVTYYLSDHVTIRAGQNRVQWEVSGDVDDATFTVHPKDGLEWESEPEEDAETILSLEYLNDVSGVLAGYDPVRMRLGNEVPVMFETDLFTMMIAPRITRE